MIRTSHTLPMTISIAGDELEFEVEIEYTCRPGTHDTWTDPGDPAEIQILGATIDVVDFNGKVKETLPLPAWIVSRLGDDGVYQALGEACNWGEDEGPDPDAELEKRRDNQRGEDQ